MEWPVDGNAASAYVTADGQWSAFTLPSQNVYSFPTTLPGLSSQYSNPNAPQYSITQSSLYTELTLPAQYTAPATVPSSPCAAEVPPAYTTAPAPQGMLKILNVPKFTNAMA